MALREHGALKKRSRGKNINAHFKNAETSDLTEERIQIKLPAIANLHARIES